MFGLTGDALTISVLLWGISITPLVQAVQEFRKSNLRWGLAYAASAVGFLLAGFWWPKIPEALEFVRSQELTHYFIIGTVFTGLVFADAMIGVKKLLSKEFFFYFVNGAYSIPFICLMILPFYPDMILEIILESKIIFVCAGFAGLVLIITDGTERRMGLLANSEDTDLVK